MASATLNSFHHVKCPTNVDNGLPDGQGRGIGEGHNRVAGGGGTILFLKGGNGISGWEPLTTTTIGGEIKRLSPEH